MSEGKKTMNISGKFLKACCTDYKSKWQLTKNKSKLTASTCTFHLHSQHYPMLHCTLSFQSCRLSAQYNKQFQGYNKILLSGTSQKLAHLSVQRLATGCDYISFKANECQACQLLAYKALTCFDSIHMV